MLYKVVLYKGGDVSGVQGNPVGDRAAAPSIETVMFVISPGSKTTPMAIPEPNAQYSEVGLPNQPNLPDNGI